MGDHFKCLQWVAVLPAILLWAALPAAAQEAREVPATSADPAPETKDEQARPTTNETPTDATETSAVPAGAEPDSPAQPVESADDPAQPVEPYGRAEADDADAEPAPILEADPSNPFQARKADPKDKPVILVREGKRLFDREGEVTRRGGETLIQFEADRPPMVLLPCKALERAENMSQYGKQALTLRACGLVYEYRSRNYLLLEEGLRTSDGGPAAPSRTNPAPPKLPAKPPATPEKPATPADRDAPPEASPLAIPEPQPEPEVKPARSEPGRPIETTGSERLVSEGVRLMDREGRIHLISGRTVFVFDAGDDPVILLANKKLERMETLADYGRKPVRFRISGLVTEYRSRNYLSMTKMVVVPKAVEKL